ncbi:hypothetical protein PIB30_061265 [Stylosanthes scabra]|uniref:Uncharacterized protein n=1 Tax=Stylosanthes scabra TaxID=79078 RepID=A0ABU6RKX5_9FABA|nr:hypothetical protein [Stylosanthes scabra]
MQTTSRQTLKLRISVGSKQQDKKTSPQALKMGNRRDKPIIEFDPKIEKTLKKNRSRVKAQRALQFDQKETNSEEGASENFSEKEIVEKNSEEEIKITWRTMPIISGELLQITLIPLLLAVEAVFFGPL